MRLAHPIRLIAVELQVMFRISTRVFIGIPEFSDGCIFLSVKISTLIKRGVRRYKTTRETCSLFVAVRIYFCLRFDDADYPKCGS